MARAYLDARLKGRDLLTLADFSSEEIRLFLDAAHELKKEL
jgi:ornithine carbamoyltransferase